MKGDDKIPPTLVWVSYCARCGVPIMASARKEDTSCPDCPLLGHDKRKWPPIRFALYRRIEALR